MGYRLEESQALSVDGNKIPGAVVMVDEEANNGNYDELTALTGIPFLVCNGSCPGAYGDHLIASDGKKWHYSEAPHESNYPAARVEFGGGDSECRGGRSKEILDAVFDRRGRDQESCAKRKAGSQST